MLREVVEAIFAVLFDDQDRVGTGFLAFGMVDQWKCKESGIYFSRSEFIFPFERQNTFELYIMFH